MLSFINAKTKVIYKLFKCYSPRRKTFSNVTAKISKLEFSGKVPYNNGNRVFRFKTVTPTMQQAFRCCLFICSNVQITVRKKQNIMNVHYVIGTNVLTMCRFDSCRQAAHLLQLSKKAM